MGNDSKLSIWWVTALAWILGLIFLAAAFLKAWDIRQLALQISYYKLIPSILEVPAAFVVVTLEALVGISLITGFQRRLALIAGSGLLLFFVAAVTFRWNLLQGKDCGCFGSFDRGGPSAVLWQDSLLLIGFGVAYWFRRRAINLLKKILITVLMTTLCLATAGYSEVSFRSKVNSLDQPAEGKLNAVVYLSSVCPHCIENGEKINKILNAPNLPPCKVYLAADNEGQISEFIRESHLTAQYQVITFSILWLMTKSVPVMELRRGETIVARWELGVTSMEEILAVVDAQSNPQK
jgi:uncharacterized membrane protein YphA (DoxX/SURF4 family)